MSQGSIWISIWEEFIVLSARQKTCQVLSKYRVSFNPTLTEEKYVTTVHSAHSTATLTASESKASEDKVFFLFCLVLFISKRINNHFMCQAEGKISGMDSKAPDENQLEATAEAEAMATLLASNQANAEDKSGASLLTAANTPDFMLLPLELQGYCPWTLVQTKGLLVPGKPSTGVVRYNNGYYVCDHALGLKAFMDNPEHYLSQIRTKAMTSPEYIHLLRVQHWFPNVSIAHLFDHPEFDTASAQKGLTKDAGTETPTHFQERHIDVNYHWNEWELRRRALKVANLKNCETTSMQTDESHFKREASSQVYLPRIKETQTRREKGTNPPVKTTYVAGLRGKMESFDSGAVSRYVKSTDMSAVAEQKSTGPQKARVVTLTLDL